MVTIAAPSGYGISSQGGTLMSDQSQSGTADAERPDQNEETQNISGAVERPRDPAEGPRSEDLPEGADTAQ